MKRVFFWFEEEKKREKSKECCANSIDGGLFFSFFLREEIPLEKKQAKIHSGWVVSQLR